MHRSPTILLLSIYLLLTACGPASPLAVTQTSLPTLTAPLSASATGAATQFVSPTPIHPVLTTTPLVTSGPTAAPLQSPTTIVSAPTEVSPGVPAGKIFFAGTRVDGLALDDEYVYWTEPGRIVRQRMESPGSSKPETVVKKIYPNGRFGLLNSQRLGEWLFFVDKAWASLDIGRCSRST